ncbi:transcriptional regulator [Pseudomonas sp. HN8-3]|uniref:transcriptional regulator n=1 Tax=Pseudomonas sp. HN8-3 TaxID=2886361 RepID=UPI001E6205DE|nr:YdaS family helix-turn-helix protein [Pseudomonas sp. HN8-3]UEH06696.1 helix-turn-helix domain-containing protein [Pseudomonas sp. HN8-3]
MKLENYMEQLPRGGKKLFAIRLGVSASYLSRLISGDRSITAERAIQLEEATAGLVGREELRPDIQWATSRRPEKKGPHVAATLDPNLRPISSSAQSTTDAVNPSSAKQAAQ